MDIGDISKVASRKRLNVDADKLREKVSRETAKIIKLKVAQDTAYWDLKEKLQQVEGNHERLQQNMVEVQMQHEAISGQYQEELRLRPETLNKMNSTREICDVLEEYSERLKETLSRCKGDQATLCEAYQKSGELVRDIKLKQVQADEKKQQHIETLEEKVKMLNEHQKQMVQYLTSAKQQADEELSSSRRELAAATTRLAEHQAAYADLRRSADLDRIELQKKEESLASLQKDMKQLLHEFNMQAGDMKNTILKQDKELKEATESNEALKKALCNQEAFTKSVCEQNNQLQEKISALEDQNCAASNALKDLDNKLQESITANDDYKNTIALLQQSKEELEKAIRDKDESLNNTEIELENLKQQLCIKDAEHAEVVKELNVTKDECSEKMAKVHDFKKLVGELENNVCELKKEMEEIRSSTAQQIQDLNTTVEEKEKELSSKASTIAQLMTELKTAGDARSRVEAQLARSKSEAAGERAAAMARETASRTQIDQLEVSVRNKDDELSKQMSIILEIRSEKERLQDKIQSMQNTIDNIQKELTGRVLPNGNRQPPDHDDNALMCPPSKELSQSPKLPTNFAVPRSEPKQLDSMLFSLFSDGSMDGDTLDQSEVNRRFEALSRGERVPPLALGALKRRAGLKYRPQRSEDVSLSQIKEDLKAKEKMFFKSKRSDPKNKRMK